MLNRMLSRSLGLKTPVVAVLVLLALLLPIFAPSRANAACDVVPGANDAFRGALGQTDRPFALPGDFVGVALEPGICDGASTGFADLAGGTTLADDYVVTLLFTPPAGTPTGVVLSTSCAAIDPLLAACGGAFSGQAVCVEVPQSDLQIVDALHLSFRFPNTDAFLAPDGDLNGFAGPVKIVASARNSPTLPCELATQRCADSSGGSGGLVACIDELFELDGTCRIDATSVDPTFGSFTALPLLNDYQAMLGGTVPVRLTVDAAGNALLPIDWTQVLVRVDGTPYPRLVRGSTGIPAFGSGPGQIRLPGASALTAWAPNGIRLPPVFAPLSDLAEPDLTLFGSVDAPRAITRVARRLPVLSRCNDGTGNGAVCTTAAQCAAGESCQPLVEPEYLACGGGANDGLSCLLATDCPDGTCGATTCRGGPDAGAACETDLQCSNECGPALFDFSDRFLGSAASRAVSGGGQGPVVIEPGLYGVEAEQAATLEGQLETDALFAFVSPEGLEGIDANGDLDALDPVFTLRDKASGVTQPIGDNGSDGRAVTRIFRPPFRFSALAAEDDLVAYLEPEPLQGQCITPGVCDQNNDGEVFDTLLRVYRLGDVAPVFAQPRAADAAPVIDSKSLEISNGLVFFRSPEWGDAPVVVSQVDVDSSGAKPMSPGTPYAAFRPTIDASGKTVCFDTNAPLVPADANAKSDVYCRDLTEVGPLLSSASTSGGGANGVSREGATSAFGRFVVFESFAGDLVAPSGGPGMFLRDRDLDQDGIYDEAGAGETKTVQLSTFGSTASAASISTDGRHVALALEGGGDNAFALDRDADGNDVFDEVGGTTLVQLDLAPGGGAPNGSSFGISMSGDGRHVAFTSLASNLVPGDIGGVADVFVHDRDTDADGIFDEPGEARTTRVSVASDGAAGDGDSRLTVVAGGRDGLSADGRFVAFDSNASNLVASDVDGDGSDAFVHDRDSDEDGIFDEPGDVATTLASLTSNGVQTTTPNLFLTWTGVSPDGRYVTFGADRDEPLVPWSTGPGGSLVRDLFVHDRLTGLLQVVNAPALGVVANYPVAPNSLGAGSLSSHARQVVFETLADNMSPADTDAASDIYVRGTPLFDAAYDLTGEGALDEIVLQVLDAREVAPVPLPLGAATRVSVAGGNAAFLSPESASVRPGVDLSDDSDTDDEVVHLYRDRAGVTNLKLAASDVAIDGDWLAALATASLSTPARAVAGVGPSGSVPALNDVGAGDVTTWEFVPRAADSIGLASGHLAFISPESGNGPSDATEDSDTADRTMECWDAEAASLIPIVDPQCAVPGMGFAACGGSTTKSFPAESFAIGNEVLAFRAPEISLCHESVASCTSGCPLAECDLSGDGDCCDDVMLAYDFVEQRLVNSRNTVVDCPFEACNPLTPFTISGATVRFIEFEDDRDLNANGITDEFLVQLFNVRTGSASTVGVVTPGSSAIPGGDGFGGGGDPLAVPPGSGSDSADQTFQSSGRCVETSGPACSDPSQCAAGEFCDSETSLCARAYDTCATDAQCPGAAECRADLVIVTTSDTDHDGVIDPLDVCPVVPDPDQQDTDHDGVGDACDLATCGDGVVATEPGSGLPLEECDDANLVDGDGCSARCRNDGPLVCDVNADGEIDKYDIKAIRLARGEQAIGPNDPRDADGNGWITLRDAWLCKHECTAEPCYVPPWWEFACGLVGFEPLAALWAARALRGRLRHRRDGGSS